MSNPKGVNQYSGGRKSSGAAGRKLGPKAPQAAKPGTERHALGQLLAPGGHNKSLAQHLGAGKKSAVAAGAKGATPAAAKRVSAEAKRQQQIQGHMNKLNPAAARQLKAVNAKRAKSGLKPLSQLMT